MGASQSANKTVKSEPVNQDDLNIVKKSWASVSDPQDLGLSIMIYIFQEHKEIKSKWIFAANLETLDEMLNNSQLKYHAKKVIDVLAFILGKLEKVEDLKSEQIITKLFRLGGSHYHYSVVPEHFPVSL